MRWSCLAVVMLAACTIDDLTLDDLPCPCVSGYVCDPATSRCVRQDRLDAGRDAGADDASPVDASFHDTSFTDASFTDASFTDASFTDASSQDAARPDASFTDASATDARRTVDAARGDARAPGDQCNTTLECQTVFGPAATDCFLSLADDSVCYCGASPCVLDGG